MNIAVKYNVLFRLFCRITKRFWYYSTVLLHDFGITQPYYYTILVLLNRITTHYCVVGLHFSVHKNRETEREGERERAISTR